MMAGVILSVDIGTSSLKAAFIDFDGRLIAFSRTAYRPEQAGPAVWERAFALALEKLHTLAPDAGIDALCVSGNGPTLAPLTREGAVLPPLLWHDGKTVLPPKDDLSGPPQSFFLPHAAWLKENEPEAYKKVNFFISCHEWLAHKLGAGIFTVLPQGSYEPYYWDEEQCRLFGLDRGKFPPFIKMGSVMGRVSAEGAASFGSCPALKSGTPIIAGGPDFITALIGTLTLKPGDVCCRAGSSEGINVCASSPVRAGAVLRVLPHAKEGFWNIGAVIPSSGRLFEKYRNDTGQDSRSYEDHLAELIPREDDTDIFRGLMAEPSVGWDSFNDTISLGRAILCKMGYAVRSALETLACAGFAANAMRVSGGQAKNSRWNQLKADIAGVSLMIPEIADGELAGNAVLAASALEASGFEPAADRMVRLREVYNPRNADFWDEQYRVYKKGSTD